MANNSMIFDVSSIIKDNYSKLESSGAHSSHIFLWILLIPYLFSILVSITPFFIDFCNIAQSNYIVSFASIIIGFLINVSVILKATETKYSIAVSLKSRVFANIFYTILIGVLLVVMIIIGTWLNPMIIYSQQVIFWKATIFMSYLILQYFLFFHFIVMLLVVMKGFYAVCK
ncbi:hypothetical protein [Methanolobus sp. ZRKC5]|uniref:hypothetical protein n=1 Tax=unclassified Methanolobus TaxID=2629569 RepID=UPI00313BA237